jgi:hypothetical protein
VRITHSCARSCCLAFILLPLRRTTRTHTRHLQMAALLDLSLSLSNTRILKSMAREAQAFVEADVSLDLSDEVTEDVIASILEYRDVTPAQAVAAAAKVGAPPMGGIGGVTGASGDGGGGATVLTLGSRNGVPPEDHHGQARGHTSDDGGDGGRDSVAVGKHVWPPPPANEGEAGSAAASAAVATGAPAAIQAAATIAAAAAARGEATGLEDGNAGRAACDSTRVLMGKAVSEGPAADVSQNTVMRDAGGAVWGSATPSSPEGRPRSMVNNVISTCDVVWERVQPLPLGPPARSGAADYTRSENSSSNGGGGDGDKPRSPLEGRSGGERHGLSLSLPLDPFHAPVVAAAARMQQQKQLMKQQQKAKQQILADDVMFDSLDETVVVSSGSSMRPPGSSYYAASSSTSSSE